MKYSMQLPNRPDSTLEVEHSYLSGKCSVWINKNLAKVLNKRKREYSIQFFDGTSTTLQIKVTNLGLGLKGYIDGMEFSITPPTVWYEYLLCYLPMILVTIGGLIGGIFGGIGVGINITIIRSNTNAFIKIFLALLVAIISFILYYLVASVFLIGLHR